MIPELVPRRRSRATERIEARVATIVADLCTLDLDAASLPALSALSMACAATQARVAVRMAAAAAEAGAPTTEQPEAFISVKEAAVRLAVGPQWIYRRRAHLPFLRPVGTRGLRVSAKAFDRYLANRRSL
jgi:excisionase family DNA binding protein